MKKIMLLSGENVQLALAEVQALGGNGTCIERVSLVKGCKEYTRLAYTQHVSKYLFKCKFSEISRQNFKIKKDYSVRIIYGSKKQERKIAYEVWKSLKDPQVNLTNPSVQIDVYILGDTFLFGEKLWENDKKYMERLPHKKPEFYPTTIIPKLAKACVNLSGLSKGKILDPFCGVGSILVEAGLMGHEVIGYDLDPKMLMMVESNLKHYKIKKYLLNKQDSTKIKKKEFDAIVTDVPYDRLVAVKEIGKLYDAFFENIAHLIIKEKMILIVPNKFKISRLKKWFNIEKEISYIVHRSLTRKILILKKTK